MEKEELRKLQKDEVIKRLEIIEKQYNLHKNVLKEFRENETIYYSEDRGGAFSGILYWLRNKEEYIEIVKNIEEKEDIFVYHCILKHTTDGDILTMLYISKYIEEWEIDHNDLTTGNVLVYVYNLEDVQNAEFGYVDITGVNGGLTTLY